MPPSDKFAGPLMTAPDLHGPLRMRTLASVPARSDPIRPHIGVDIDSRGLTSFNPGQTHPIMALIERGRRLAAAMDDRIDACETLDNSHDDYVEAFGMQPPRGFKEWYEFTSIADPPSIPLASLYPWVHEPMVPFLSLPSAELRRRTWDLEGKKGTFTFMFVPDGQGDEGTACEEGELWLKEDWATRGKGRVKVSGPESWKFRSK